MYNRKFLNPIFALTSLLNLEPGMGSYGRKAGPGAGTMRRQAREAAYRKQQAKRLANAAPPKFTRQQRRRMMMGRS